MGRIVAVCTSASKGTPKTPVSQGMIQADYGLAGDAHADEFTHRQVSLLDMSSVAKMKALGLDVGPGAFGENLTTEGLVLVALPIGTRLGTKTGVIMEISQIGKECHDPCAIGRQVGTCIMPTEGVFARVISGGPVRAGDELSVLE